MSKKKDLHFRINTPQLLRELYENNPKMGVFKIPFRVLQGLLIELATRCTEIHDPVLDRIMFDMALYELPSPVSVEYRKLMRLLYRNEKVYRKNQRLHIKQQRNDLSKRRGTLPDQG